MIAGWVAVLALAGTAHGQRGTTYNCHFPKAGHVVIDTREPGASITVNGKRYPATDGSYFYQSTDGNIVVMFSPDMKRWGFGDEDLVRCTARPNRK